MNKRSWNWFLWVGFALCPLGLVSYIALFSRYPVTRDVPWANFLIFAVAAFLLFVGIVRALGQPDRYRGKIAGPILATLGAAVLVLFCVFIFYLSRQLPKSEEAPRIGSRAPDFVLPDTSDRQVSLASLLSDPFPQTHMRPKGVLLVFYRGYW